MKELFVILGMCILISLLSAGLLTWILTRATTDIQHKGVKGVVTQLWNGTDSPTPTPNEH